MDAWNRWLESGQPIVSFGVSTNRLSCWGLVGDYQVRRTYWLIYASIDEMFAVVCNGEPMVAIRLLILRGLNIFRVGGPLGTKVEVISVDMGFQPGHAEILPAGFLGQADDAVCW